MENRKRDAESGELVIESTFIVTISIFVIFAMLSMGMYLYQQAVVRIAAEKTAEDIALVYHHLNKEPFYGYTAYYDFTGDSINYTYRNTFNAAKMRDANRDKAVCYAYGLINRMSLRGDEYQKADVDVKIVTKGIIEHYVVVEISQDYTMPVSGSVFGLIGIPEKLPISASASAKVFDMTDMMSSYNFTVGVIDDFTEAVIGKLLPAATQWLKFVKRIFGW